MSCATFPTSILQFSRYLSDPTIDDQFVHSDAVLLVDVYDEIAIIVHVTDSIILECPGITQRTCTHKWRVLSQEVRSFPSLALFVDFVVSPTENLT